MTTPSIQTLITQAQQVLNLKSTNEIRATLAAVLANANVGTPLNPSLTTQQLWDEFYEIVRQPSDDIMSIVVDQMMRMVFSPPAPGGAGADKQVIFNDGGVLAGDAGLTYNKATDALTITGDLTVDTSTLKVDATNNRVGIGTATPNYILDVLGASPRFHIKDNGTGTSLLDIENGAGTLFVGRENSTGSSGLSGVPYAGIMYLQGAYPLIFGTNFVERYRIGSTGISTWSVAGTNAMTLDSTGLGIGMAPLASSKLSLFGGTGDTSAADTISSLSRTSSTGNVLGGKLVLTAKDTAFGNLVFRIKTTASSAESSAYYTDALTIDGEKGNVGVGVTPSAWGSLSKAIEVGSYSAFSGNSSTASAYVSNNACLSTNNDTTGWVYKATDTGATLYKQGLGTHRWYYAGAGTAGGAVTFTNAMTLDASGNLLVGLTSGGLVSSASRLRITTGSGPTIDAQSTVAANAVVEEWNSDTTGDNIFNRFRTEAAGTTRGSISYNRAGGLVAYNVTSDYRSKDIIGPVSNSGSLIDSLKVYVGKMKGATIARPMLIAHEAQEVAPYSVTGLKDEVDADGKDKYQQIDVSSFVPLLIAEIQSLRTRVQTLEAR